MKDDLTIKSVSWLGIAVLLLFVSVIPQFLIVPLVFIIAMLAFEVYEDYPDLKLGNYVVELGMLAVVVLGIIAPTAFVFASGYALGKAIDLGESLLNDNKQRIY